LATKTALEVPADSKWRHVVAATVLAAVRAGEGRRPAEIGPKEIGEMGDLSLLLDRVLDDVDGWGGVTRLLIEVGSDPASATVTVIGQGDDIEAPSWPDQAAGPTFTDPLTGSRFEWSPDSITCSFRVSATR
jgi:hypothetical protein